jgi:hypothetical protein
MDAKIKILIGILITGIIFISGCFILNSLLREKNQLLRKKLKSQL